MSVFYDLASLVLVPSGYKASKVYAQKPLTTDGQLTFTRSNDTATRVGPDGLIEKVRTNLMTYSEDWSNAAWTKLATTVTANATTNPIDGATTADAIFETTFNGQHNFYQGFTTVVGTEVTISFYAKANGRTKLRMNNGSSALTAAFDLTAVTASMLVGTGTPTITSVGSGWYRCSITYNALQTTEYVAMNFRNDTDQDSYAGDITKGMFFFGAQAETGVLTSYIATTSAAVSVGPVANVPRLDYLNSSCPRLLLEPQRTNLFTYSEQLNTGTSGATATPNQAVSPDGYTNADLITGAGANNYIAKGISGAFSGTHTFSIFLKAGTDSAVGLNIYDGSYYSATYNLATGVASGTGASIVSYGNGWYRCILTRTTSANPVEVSVGSIGDGLTIYAWGGQFEANASYATSYIPTLGVAVTRGSDVCNKTGISSLIGQTEGTLFLEAKVIDANGGAFYQVSLSDGTNNNAALLGFMTTAGQIRFLLENGGIFQASIFANGINTSNSVKLALAYKANDFVLYVNGVQAGTDTSGSIPSFTQFQFANGSNTSTQMYGSVNQALVFKTRLTNAQLAELTTL